MKRTYIVSLLILMFRFFDLLTTKLAVNDFINEEQNLIVKIFKLNIEGFFILEFFLALFFVFCYIYYSNNIYIFDIKKKSFKEYINYYFFKKDKSSVFDWLFKMKLNRVIILFGSIAPFFIITLSTIFSLNNIWVYLFNKGDEIAVKYYLLFNKIYFFDLLIFGFPPLFLILLLYKKLYNNYLLNKIQVS